MGMTVFLGKLIPFPSVIYASLEWLDHMEVLRILRNVHIVFYNGCVDLHSYQHRKKIPSLKPSPELVVFLFSVSESYYELWFVCLRQVLVM